MAVPTAESSAIYAETVLEPGNIRLLELYPGDNDATLRGRLFTASTSADYEAVSYTWGRSSTWTFARAPPDCSIWLVSGVQIVSYHISENLYHGLKRLRQACKSRILWVDALCIDQTNTVERGQQVALMGKIYSHADCVLVWFGTSPGTFSSTESFNRLFNDLIEKSGPPVGADKEMARIQARNFFGIYNRSALLLLAVTWFDRIWIVQEYVLAKEVRFFWGPAEIAPALLRGTLTALDEYFTNNSPSLHGNYSFTDDQVAEFSAQARVIKNLIELRDGGTRNTLAHYVLEIARDRHCTDDRDRVYGMLGIVTGHQIKPSYAEDMSVLDVMMQFVENGLSARDLTVLHGGSIGPDDGSPSFIPRFDHSPSKAKPVYSTALPFRSGIGSEVKATIDVDRVLRIKGVVVDTVQRCVKLVPTVYSSTHFPQPLWLERLIPWINGNLLTNLTVSRDEPDLLDTTGVTLNDILQRWRSASPPYSEESRFSVVFRTIVSTEPKLSRKYAKSAFASCNASFERSALNEWLDPAFVAETYKRAMFTTSSEYLGLANSDVRSGDQIVIFDGDLTPMVLRRAVPEGTYKIVGDCYLHGWMDGDYFGRIGRKNDSPGILKKEDFLIV